MAGPAWTAAPTPGSWRGVGPAANVQPRRGLRTLSGWLQGLLWTCGAVAALMTLFAFAAAGTYADALNGFATETEVLVAEDDMFTMTGFWFFAYLASAVLWIIWLFRSHKQLEAIRGRAGRHGRGWTIGGWFVPIANLWIPKQVHDDLYQLSTWDEPVPASRALLNWWWVMWIVSFLVSMATGGVSDPSTYGTDAYAALYYTHGLWGLAEVALSVLAVFVVRRTTARLDRAGALAGLPA